MVNAEEIYVSIGRLLEDTPSFDPETRLSLEETKWMARAYGLLTHAGMHLEAATVKTMMDALTTSDPYWKPTYAPQLLAALHRAQAIAELNAPSEVRGAFISAGSAFDAMTVVGRVLAQASVSARIVDPYMDEKALTDFALLASPSVRIELLTDSATVKPTLSPAVARWKQQYTQERPLDARSSMPRALHDRLIVIDSSTVWTLTQSLNAFAARSPASIVRIDGEAAGLKIAAYEAFWTSATVI